MVKKLQGLLSVGKTNTGVERFVIHPQKSSVVLKRNPRSSKACADSTEEWYLGSTVIPLSTQATHLGVVRAEKNENIINITERISLARRTLYALMKSGMHGSNGLGPMVSYKLYQSYVLPRLLYSIEVLSLTKAEMKMLADFHVDLLRKIQALPSGTALAAVHLLLGALPMEEELHKRQLSLLFSVISSNNTTLRQVMTRQLALGDELTTSFFNRVSRTLELYELPAIQDLLARVPTKLQWKKLTRQALSDYWTRNLFEEANNKSTLQNCHLVSLRIGSVHPVWSSVRPSLQDVKRSFTKARLLTGTYLFQSIKSKFNNHEVDPKCPLCRLESEDLRHFLLRCTALNDIRRVQFAQLRELVVEEIGVNNWTRHFRNKEILVSLIVDCQKLVPEGILPESSSFLEKIESLTRTLCYKMHIEKLKLHRLKL